MIKDVIFNSFQEEYDKNNIIFSLIIHIIDENKENNNLENFVVIIWTFHYTKKYRKCNK